MGEGSGFGEWLRARMTDQRVTLAQVSRAAGCDYTYLWRMLHSDTARGRRYRRPSFDMTRRIGEALGAPEEALAAAGYADPAALQGARVADRLAEVERHLAELRDSLTTSAWQVRQLPVLGRIQAGAVNDPLEAADDWIEVPDFMGLGAEYALRVQGDSMAPSLVEGDLVLIRRQEEAEPGQIVAVAIGPEVTLKRFERAGGAPRLVADNEDWAPLALDGSTEARVLGVVVGSYRPAEVLRRRPR
jgi:repressor LexA